MSVFFLDTSALVKRYVAEVGSQTVTELVSAPHVTIVVADITRAEFASALNRRLREGSVSAEQHRPWNRGTSAQRAASSTRTASVPTMQCDSRWRCLFVTCLLPPAKLSTSCRLIHDSTRRPAQRGSL